MKTCLTISFLFFAVVSWSQENFQGTVRDSKTREPLPYCSVSIKGSNSGTITNTDGTFLLKIFPGRDTVLFSYLGYKALAVPSSKIVLNNSIFLEQTEVQLKEVTVNAKDDFLYQAMDKCRKKLLEDQTQHSSKVYYGLETLAKDRPVELLECYYNGYFDGTMVNHLMLKNGRIGLAGLDNRFFLSLNSSKAISEMKLTAANDHCPAIPLQYNKKAMKKLFRLEMVYSDDKMYNIKFSPREMIHERFSGNAWIDKETFQLLKISLSVVNTTTHPFMPLFPCDSLFRINLEISQTFRQENKEILPDHINFNYSFMYKSVRDTPTVKVRSINTRELNSRGILYFYDYDKPFILPFFDYDNDYDDYRKISIIPYNEQFWKNTSAMLLTEKQKENLGFLSHEGCLVNFREGNYGRDFLVTDKSDSTFYNFYSGFYEFYYTFWAPDRRITLNRKLKHYTAYTPEQYNARVLSDLYSLRVQILLDVTQVKDSLYCRSYTVFDAAKTFYHLPSQPWTNAFLNIYFDICEIERLKMEKELNVKVQSRAGIEAIYNKTCENMDAWTKKYLKEVQAGRNQEKLAEWNQYVITNLGIDNIQLFLQEEKKDK